MRLKWICLTLVAGAAFLGAASKSDAQPLDDTINYTNAFDNAASVTSWIYWYGNGSNNNAMTWDSTVDANSNVNSGALLFDTVFPSGNQLAWFGTFGNRWAYDTAFKHNATKYTNIVFDIHVDRSSTLSQAGTFGNLQIGFYDGPNVLASQPIPASATNGWDRIVQPINPSTPNLSSVSGIAFRIQTYDNFNNPVGPLRFWIDNLRVIVSPVKLPPPTMSPIITEPVSGLNLFSRASADQYQRTNIKLISTVGTGWLGHSNVTYSFTIKNFPSAVPYTNYQAHIFLTTGAGNNSGLDYADTNVIFLDIKANANGTANGVFRYKTNQPQGNAMIYGAGTLGSVGSSNILGTWSLTFNQDTNITVTAPDGNTFVTNITADAAALFAEPLNVVFGAQPNPPSTNNITGNIGQAVVLANASITNAGDGTSIVNDNFLADNTLDTGTWMPLAAAANTVLLFPADPGQKLVKWTLPDTGFGLQTTSNLSDANSWATLSGNEATGAQLTTFITTGFRTALIPSAILGPNQNFFRLFTRNFMKLQVLMPGETAAPGTASGKTGTPDPQQVGIPFNVTVNAVDANWNLSTRADDTVHVTSSDAAATLPADAALVGGTATRSVTFNTAASATVTAADVTDPSKTANTGSSTTVSP